MNQDTKELLKQCNAGCKCATNSMEQVMSFVQDKPELKALIDRYNERHIDLGDECHAMLNEEGLDERDPTTAAKIFSWFSTEVKLLMNDSGKTVAGIMIDGCAMGIKSLNGYLNQYKDASERSRRLTRKLIDLEQEFSDELMKHV